MRPTRVYAPIGLPLMALAMLLASVAALAWQQAPAYAQASCTTLCYVSPSGNDSSNGASPATPLRTIGAALTAVSPGGTIRVAAGTYNESLAISKAVTVEGANPGVDAEGKPRAPVVIVRAAGATADVVTIAGPVQGVTLRNLRLTNGRDAVLLTGAGAPAISNVALENIEAVANSRHGLYGLFGAADSVRNISVVHSRFTGSRAGGACGATPGANGVLLAGGLKDTITISRSSIDRYCAAGINLGDGVAQRLELTYNTLNDNGVAGILVQGLRSPGRSAIDFNRLLDNGRIGIELRNPAGNGRDDDAEGVVVLNNFVGLNEGYTANGEQRDWVGIAVIRRDVSPAYGHPDTPRGIVVRDNYVIGYQRAPGSTNNGIGIVIEGIAIRAYRNSFQKNDVGLQIQAGNQGYPGNSLDEPGTNTLYYDRGNSPSTCVSIGETNIYYDNVPIRTRVVGPAEEGAVVNLTKEQFHCSIAAALAAPTTTDGDVLLVGPGVYREQVTLAKAVELRGMIYQQAMAERIQLLEENGGKPYATETTLAAPATYAGGPLVNVTAAGARINGIAIDAAAPAPSPRVAVAIGGTADGLAVRNTIVVDAQVAAIALDGGSDFSVSNSFLALPAGGKGLSLANLTGPAGVADLLIEARAGVAAAANTYGLEVRDAAGALTVEGLTIGQKGGTLNRGVSLENVASALIRGSSINRSQLGVRHSSATAGLKSLRLEDSSLSGGVDGLHVIGADAQAALKSVAFAGQSGNYIMLVGSPRNIDARTATFAGLAGRVMTSAQYAAVAAKIVDKNDDPALGQVLLSDPRLLVVPDSLRFNAALTIGDPVARTLTVSNSAAASGPLSWDLAIGYGAGASGWLGCAPLSGTLNPGASAQVNCSASIAGRGVGTYTATATVSSNTPGVLDSPKAVPVTLRVTQNPEPAVFATPASGSTINFGPVRRGETGRQSVRLVNEGTASLSVSVQGALAAPFGLAAGGPFTIAPEQEVVVQVTCAPTRRQIYSANLRLTTNDPTQPALSYPLACSGDVSQLYLPFINR
ncbi:MAG TPA: choice-of-anchor D domain-containing protein [Chloroflexaceae bacterium]|nr:choice-of-anchor D domain-containing protein [Chloroflexaceae bacterium]